MDIHVVRLTIQGVAQWLSTYTEANSFAKSICPQI